MATTDPYEAPRSPLEDSRDEPTGHGPDRRRSGMGRPFGTAAPVGWMFPGGFMLTWFIFAVSACAVVARKDREALPGLVLGGIGLLAYILISP